MSLLLSYFWPAFAAGLLAGVFAGLVAFRQSGKRVPALVLGVTAAFSLAALWHGPLGAADRLSAQVERRVHGALVYYEMTQLTAHLHHGPLTRRVIFSGQADEFQKSELARLISQVPGVSSANWSNSGGVPLIVEGAAASILGFLFGLLLAYLIELHRRHNAQWNW